MYKKLSKVFVSTISIFSLGLMTIPVCASQNISHKSSGIQNFKNIKNNVTVKNEQELIDALKNESVEEIIIEGNVEIVKNIDLRNLTRNVKIIVGSQNAPDSSLVVIQGTRINGAGKLTIVKNNDQNKSMISFRKVMSTGTPRQTVFQNLNILGNANETIVNNTIDNLLLKNISIKDSILFENQKTDTQILQKMNFINSSINLNQSQQLEIVEKSVIIGSNSIYFNGIVDPKITKENLRVVAIDKSGEIVESRNIQVDSVGNVQAVIENLTEGTDYNLYIVKFDGEGENMNLFFSIPVSVSTLDFKSSVESTNVNSAQIKISKNSLEQKYYPLYLILKLGDNELKKIEIDQTVSQNMIFDITDLKEDSRYNYEIVSYLGGTNPLIIDKGEFKTLRGTIVSGENDSNSMVLNFSISQDDIKKSNIEDTSIKLYLNENIKSYAKHGKNFQTNLKGVDVEFVDGKFLINKLIPGKTYNNLKISFEIQNGRKVIVSIPRFKTIEETTDINKFVKDVYFNALNRDADELGFWYWVDNLSSNKISAGKFVKNLLNEDEFISMRPTTKSKIEGLYKVIVNRKSDKEGLDFWVNTYESLVNKGYSEELALKVVADKMINEDEFKDIIRRLRLK